ncbi:trans-sulfuration enzyme family protein [Nesterenkonia halobia]|uniref:Aminotransferase class I/II-fold pyridoxal phosphate-dependent enzyme n=1 Tax=Nesterenkonia halobia TaxID=37922 RepID=A0ABP6RGU0_9MICC
MTVRSGAARESWTRVADVENASNSQQPHSPTSDAVEHPVAGHHPHTYVVSAGRGGPEGDPHAPGASGVPVNAPVDFSSTYSYRPDDDGGRLYAREGMPTWEPLEELLAHLEGGTRSTWSGEGFVATEQQAALQVPPALLFGSGMAAIAAVVHLLPIGGHIILPRHSYNGTSALVDELAAEGRLTAHRVDIADTEAVQTTLADVATLAQAQEAPVMLWAESPTNPMLEVADLPALLAEARRRGVLTAVDNTFATPLRQRPLQHGADIVVHSVTKFLAGHSDLVMGAAVAADPQLRERLRRHRSLHGAVPGPMEVFLALRGVRTLAVRLDAAEANAAELAVRLEQLAASGETPLQTVSYPGLASHPQHERAGEQLAGCGAIIALHLPDVASADAVLSALRVWTPATSLGGVESLAERRRRHGGEPDTVPEGLIRLSVGIEHVDDLHADLVQALRLAGGVRPDNPAETR